MGYTNVYRYPEGFHGWKAAFPKQVEGQQPEIRPLAVGDAFPDCRLAVLNGDDDRRYLGLPDDAKWLALSDLKARFVLIQLYNTMCSECVIETRKLMQFYRTVEADPILAGRLKIIGIGIYDTNRAVVHFKKHYDVLYPLFSDQHGQIFDCLGQAQVPLAYFVRAKGNGTWIIELVKRGYFDPDEKFLKTLKLAVARSEELD